MPPSPVYRGRRFCIDWEEGGVIMLCPQELTVAITAVANGLYETLNAEELTLLAAVLVQLGDTLVTLSAQKALQARCCGRGMK